jgi:CDP-diacylglycerol--serine O-phosphatidyltransferase
MATEPTPAPANGDNPEAKLKIYFLPNLLTAGTLFCGFLALTKIVEANLTPSPEGFINWMPIKLALGFILLACIFDLFDGRVARMGGVESPFGREFDSLADLVSFGLAPALLVHSWALAPLGTLAVWACFAFVACGAIRLARFNVLAMSSDGSPKKPGKYILGLPIPGAAGILVSLVTANHAISGGLSSSPIPILCVVLALSFFMVSTIRFRSFKDLRMNLRTLLLVGLALGSSVVLALELHIAFALGWLLVSYVAIGLVETIFSLTRRAARLRRRRPDSEPTSR